MPDKRTSHLIIDSLRKGIPPHKGIEHYAVGYEKLLKDIAAYHFSAIGDGGIIRFVNGSWGAGKTHFFRLLRDGAFKNRCLVSSVELSAQSSTLDKFESVYAAIMKNIALPGYFEGDELYDVAPFRQVLQESLQYLAHGSDRRGDILSREDITRARQKLLSHQGIDIDFKKMVAHFWESSLMDSPEPASQEERREVILQWFCGEGSLAFHKKLFGVTKVITRDNAKTMLSSLSAFIKLSGYRGLVILFDEAEKSYSTISRLALKKAHNNLLSLINNVDTLRGLFLIYATTPDFFTDPKHGIAIYGALASRVGSLKNTQPRALDIIWNLDTVEFSLADYQQAGRMILSIYHSAYSDKTGLPSPEELDRWVADYEQSYSRFAGVRFWRVLVSGIVSHLDDRGDDRGDDQVRSAQEVYDDIMDRFREE
jgi:hypothetical protein